MYCINCNIELTLENASLFFNKYDISNINNDLNNNLNENDIICNKCLEEYKKNNDEGNENPKHENSKNNLIGEIIIPNDLFNVFINSVFKEKIINPIEIVDNKTNNDNKRPIINNKRRHSYSTDEEIHIQAQKKLEETYPYEWLGDDIKNIEDLIRLGKIFDKKKPKKKRYNLNIRKLNKLVSPLSELNNMIGLDNLKDSIFNQIIYYLQELDNKNTDMLHTVIQGPPGVGKTHVCQIMAKIYKNLGFLKKDQITTVKRDDLIGKYLGQTADKTRKLLDKALGGVLFIDEAYSLGDTEGRDSYSKEAIDMLTSYLSEHPHDLICIIAGYKEALDKRFFRQNEGLSRRFTHRFDIDKYNPEELRLIFFKIVQDSEWSIKDKDNVPIDFFEEYIDLFEYNGGDMLTLFGFCKKTHSLRLLKIKDEEELKSGKKKITYEDVKNGLKLFLKNLEYASLLTYKNLNCFFT